MPAYSALRRGSRTDSRSRRDSASGDGKSTASPPELSIQKQLGLVNGVSLSSARSGGPETPEVFDAARAALCLLKEEDHVWTIETCMETINLLRGRNNTLKAQLLDVDTNFRDHIQARQRKISELTEATSLLVTAKESVEATLESERSERRRKERDLQRQKEAERATYEKTLKHLTDESDRLQMFAGERDKVDAQIAALEAANAELVDQQETRLQSLRKRLAEEEATRDQQVKRLLVDQRDSLREEVEVSFGGEYERLVQDNTDLKREVQLQDAKLQEVLLELMGKRSETAQLRTELEILRALDSKASGKIKYYMRMLKRQSDQIARCNSEGGRESARHGSDELGNSTLTGESKSSDIHGGESRRPCTAPAMKRGRTAVKISARNSSRPVWSRPRSGRLDREMRTAPVLSNKRARPGGENQQGCTPDPRCATRPRSTGSLCSNQCHAALAQGAEKIHGKACADGIPSSPSPSQQPSQAFIGERYSAVSVDCQAVAHEADPATTEAETGPGRALNGTLTHTANAVGLTRMAIVGSDDSMMQRGVGNRRKEHHSVTDHEQPAVQCWRDLDSYLHERIGGNAHMMRPRRPMTSGMVRPRNPQRQLAERRSPLWANTPDSRKLHTASGKLTRDGNKRDPDGRARKTAANNGVNGFRRPWTACAGSVTATTARSKGRQTSTHDDYNFRNAPGGARDHLRGTVDDDGDDLSDVDGSGGGDHLEGGCRVRAERDRPCHQKGHRRADLERSGRKHDIGTAKQGGQLRGDQGARQRELLEALGIVDDTDGLTRKTGKPVGDNDREVEGAAENASFELWEEDYLRRDGAKRDNPDLWLRQGDGHDPQCTAAATRTRIADKVLRLSETPQETVLVRERLGGVGTGGPSAPRPSEIREMQEEKADASIAAAAAHAASVACEVTAVDIARLENEWLQSADANSTQEKARVAEVLKVELPAFPTESNTCFVTDTVDGRDTSPTGGPGRRSTSATDDGGDGGPPSKCRTCAE